MHFSSFAAPIYWTAVVCTRYWTIRHRNSNQFVFYFCISFTQFILLRRPPQTQSANVPETSRLPVFVVARLLGFCDWNRTERCFGDGQSCSRQTLRPLKLGIGVRLHRVTHGMRSEGTETVNHGNQCFFSFNSGRSRWPCVTVSRRCDEGGIRCPNT